MPISAIIFDVDGTLIDSNGAHVEAWQRAFARHGYEVTQERITVEIGKGGDKLVPSILGEAAEAKDGESLRAAQTGEFIGIAGSRELRPFPGARELAAELRRRGIRTALATSSGGEHLDALAQSSGLDLRRFADELVSADDIEETKPAPDLVQAAVRKLGAGRSACAMIGDTPYDAEACGAAGVACIGVRSGGNGTDTLLQAGARLVVDDLADLLARLAESLESL